MTLSELRRHWLKEVEEYDRIIELADKGEFAGPAERPGRQWTGMVRGWRDELKALLAQYPIE